MSVRIILLLALLGSLLSCTPQKQQDDSRRDVLKGDAQLSYQPARMLTEAPLRLAVTTPNGWQLHKALLVGVSMQMPTMPLFFTPAAVQSAAQQRWQTEFLLGACSDPAMTWRLELLFIDETGAEQRLSDEFVVYRR